VAPGILVRKVRFEPTEGVGTEKWYPASEGMGGEVERGKNVGELVREGMRRRQGKRLEGEGGVE